MILLFVATGMVTPDPLGHARCDEPELASYLQIEERELEGVGSPNQASIDRKALLSGPEAEMRTDRLLGKRGVPVTGTPRGQMRPDS
jgi:hypothetical protein